MDRPKPRLRSPLMRKKKTTPISDKVQLERVLGLTSTSNASLACDQHTGTIAYSAGCVVVLYNAKRNKQSHILNASKKTITCVAFTADGKYLATGESGHQPAVRVWEVETKTQYAEFKGHKFGISCVSFSPNMKQVISIGTQHDMAINVWNWRSKAKISSNKVAAKVTQVAFAEDSSSFVTVGNRHVKFWYLGATKARVNETVPLQGRSGILGDQKNNFFCGVGCGRGELANNTYCITESGLLCQFNEKRLLDKWVELRTTSAHCISVGEKHIYIGCADGVVRVFSAKTLHFLATLPRPHYLGVDVASGMEPGHMIPNKNTARYPDTIGLVLDDNNRKVTAVYNDHSMYIWDVSDINHVGKSRSFLYHSSCIWGIEMYEGHEDELKNPLPPLSFITCSSDDTIRIWNLDPHMSNSGNLKRNIYSQDLLKTIYTDKEYSNLKSKSFNPAGNKDKTDTQCLEKNGIRCVKVNPDGQHLASGDRVGNIRIHDLATMTDLCMLEAHESEVLCLQYTNPETGVKLLTSASRDRLIHVFDTEQEYGIVQTLDDHSSAITSIQFSEMEGQLHMLSCGADKSILFRTAQQEPEFEFVLNRHLVGKTTLYDMDVDATKKYVATACQDRNVRIYNIKNGKQKKCYKGSIGDDGTIIKIQLDPSGAYAATSCSDKNLCIFDFFTGECVASMFGHSELVTGIKFMPDLRHLVSVSGDGCIFVWKLPYEFTEHMQARLVELGKLSQEQIINTEIRRGTFIPNQPFLHSKSETDFAPASKVLNDENKGFDSNATSNKPEGMHRPGYRFSVGQLPTWAKKQVLNEPQAKPVAPDLPNVPGPKGRWAQRVETQGIVMKSILDENAAIQLSLSDCMDKRRFTVEPDSLQEQLKGLNLRRETIIIPKPENKLQNIPIITDDENNRDDDEDDEFCSNRDQLEQMLDDAQNLREPDGMDGKITLNRGQGEKYRSSAPFAMTPPGRRLGLSRTPGRYSDSSLLMKADSLDEDDEEPEEGEPDTKEVIFYFPNDGSETSDTSSFQVMEGDTASYRDADHTCKESEGTDPHSLDSDEDIPTPTTPTKEFSSGSDKEEGFLRSHFENLGTPAKEGFSSNPDALNYPLDPSDPGNFFNSRLSISSRFLSRSQQQHLRALAIQSGALAPSPRSVSPNPNMENNNVSWKSDTIPEKEVSWSSNSPPSKDLPDPVKHDKGHRNSYGSLDRRSRKEEKATKMDVRLDSPNHPSPDGLTPPSRSKSERNLSTESTDSDSSAKRRTMQRQHSYQMATRSSSAKMSKSGSTSAINKSVLDDGPPGKAPGSPKKSGAVSRRRTGGLDAGMKNKFKSTPDLSSQLDDDDDDDFIINPRRISKTMEDLKEPKVKASSRRSMPAQKEMKDPFGIRTKPTELDNFSSDSLSSTSDRSLRNSVSPENRRRGSSQEKDLSKAEQDRLAMPPPPVMPVTSKAKSKPQDSFVKKANTRSRNSTPDLTLDQAKAILLGRSTNLKHNQSDSDSQSSASDRPESAMSGTSGFEDQQTRNRSQSAMGHSGGSRPSTSPGRSSLSPPKSTHPNHHADLDASPMDLPVKDHSPGQSSGLSDCPRSPGRRIRRILPEPSPTQRFQHSENSSTKEGSPHHEPHEGSPSRQIADMPQLHSSFVRDRTSIFETLSSRPGSPLKRSPSPVKTVKDTRSMSVGDMKQVRWQLPSGKDPEMAVAFSAEIDQTRIPPSTSDNNINQLAREASPPDSRSRPKSIDIKPRDNTRTREKQSRSPSPREASPDSSPDQRPSFGRESPFRWRRPSRPVLECGEGDETGEGDLPGSPSKTSPPPPIKWTSHPASPGIKPNEKTFPTDTSSKMPGTVNQTHSLPADTAHKQGPHSPPKLTISVESQLSPRAVEHQKKEHHKSPPHQTESHHPQNQSSPSAQTAPVTSAASAGAPTSQPTTLTVQKGTAQLSPGGPLLKNITQQNLQPSFPSVSSAPTSPQSPSLSRARENRVAHSPQHRSTPPPPINTPPPPPPRNIIITTKSPPKVITPTSTVTDAGVSTHASTSSDTTTSPQKVLFQQQTPEGALPSQGQSNTSSNLSNTTQTNASSDGSSKESNRTLKQQQAAEPAKSMRGARPKAATHSSSSSGESQVPVPTDHSHADSEEEIKRPDKTRTSPPTTLITPLGDVKSHVMLTQPSPQPSAPPDRTKLSLPLQGQAAPRQTETNAYSKAADDLWRAAQNAIQLCKKETNDSGKESREALLTVLKDTYKLIGEVCPTAEEMLLDRYSKDLSNKVLKIIKDVHK